ncbi:deoxynucleoside kinase, partial [Candidatus Saccharibacteria bacterium]|nr:deoxynucleoside kinase [Candidatus Saccharibacteria bacterium]
MSAPGVFIVLEGSDGSGKGTQFNLLKERLGAVGYDVATYDFPRYEEDSSHFVKEYLNGNYGPASEISPYTASLFYALDRYEASKQIILDLERGKIVLANRYVGSNMAHQGSKFGNPQEQRGFFVWDDNLEYELLKLPRPDINIFLRVPAEVSYDLIAKKAARKYTSNSRDEHEGDIKHLKKSVATYDLLCQLFPKDFKAIDCVDEGGLMSIPRVSDLIWNKIQAILPAEKPLPGHAAVVTLGDTKDKILNYTPKDAPDRLSMPFKSASLLLRLQIESDYPGSTVPKTWSWADSDYAYFTPQSLPKDLKPAFKQIIEGIADRHRQILKKLSYHYEKSDSEKKIDIRSLEQLLIRLTPLCAIVPFDAVIGSKEVPSLTRSLLESDSHESQWASKQIYLLARELWPADFKKPLETSDTMASS